MFRGNWHEWIAGLLGGTRRRSPVPVHARRSPLELRIRLERLESRTLLALSSLAVSDAAATEGDAGSANMVFTITRSGDLASAITVGYNTADGSALAAGDYTAVPSGTVVIPSGSATATITIAVTGDTLSEASENFTVNLTGILDTSGPTPTFSAKQDFSTASTARFVAVGDLNGDGRPDLAVAQQGSNQVSVLFNTTPAGAGTASYSAPQDFAVSTTPLHVAIADVNGDGRPDLVATNVNAASVSVLLNVTAPGAATPSFSPRQDFGVGQWPFATAVADLNGDGRPDLAVANYRSGQNSVSVLLNTTAPGAAAPSFAARQDFVSGTQPLSVAAGDLNGDGKPDLALANFGSGDVSVLLNNTVPGAATFAFAAHQDFACDTNSHSIALADFNGDGRLDFAVANTGADTVSVRFNATTPGSSIASFGPRQDFATGLDPQSVTTGDFNGDGKTDLAVANDASGSVSILLNATLPGAATAALASRQDYTAGTRPFAVAAADLNGDGRLDVVAANLTSNNVSVLLNSTALPAGMPDFPQTAMTTGVNPELAVAGDLNGDGQTDLVVANRLSNSVSVLRNTTSPGAAAPTFAARQDFTTGTNPFGIVVGDLNGDGKPDLSVVNFGANTVSVLLNTTAPGAASFSFAGKQDFATGTTPIAVARADFNGDGKPDLAIANRDSASVSVLLNTTSSGGSTVSFSPREDFTTSNGPHSVAVGDINGDGKPDIAATTYSAGVNTVALLVNTTAPGAATPTFAARTDITPGAFPHWVIFADLNNDGKPDLATANLNSNTVSVFRNATTPGATTPSFARQDFTSGSGGPVRLAAADFNGDGRLDLAVTNPNTNSVSALFNSTPAGSSTFGFSAPQTWLTGTHPRSVTTADFNGDGKADIATSNASSDSASVLINTPVIIADAQGIGTILDNDRPTLTVSDASLTEGNAGTVNLIFTVSRTGDLANVISVGYSTAGGSAAAPADFAAASAVVTFAAGAASAAISVAVSGDTLDEIDETFLVNLSSLAVVGAAGSFAAKQDFTVGDQPFAVAFGDLNGDGKPDMCVANLSSDSVSVFMNTTPPGAAMATFAAKQDIVTGFSLKSVVLGDLNGDGRLDLVVANRFSGSVSVLFSTIAPGSFTASFSAQQVFAVGPNPNSIALADLNSDGRLDLAVANRDAASVSVLLNTTTPGGATPSFAARQDFATGSQPVTVAAADLNGDGRLDLVTANLGSHNTSALVNTTSPGSATAGFASHQTFAAGMGTIAVAVSDLNGDGRPDLATANSGANTASVLLNASTIGSTALSFTAKQDFAVGSFPRAIVTADFNNDGLVDLAVANRNENTMSVLYSATHPSSTAASFGNRQDYATGVNPDDVAVRDLNNDGKVDLAYTNENSDSVSLFMNSVAISPKPVHLAGANFATADDPRAVAVGDLNGDGRGDVVAASNGTNVVTVLLNTTSPGAAAPAFAARQDFTIDSESKAVAIGDLNGDGRPDLAAANYSTSKLTLLLNTTAPGAASASFAAPQELTIFTRSTAVVIQDFNGDGVPDLAVASRDSNAASIFLNTTPRGSSTLSFAARNDFATASSPRSLIAVDINGDGRPDLAAACNFGSAVSVLLNTTAAGAATASFATRTDFATGAGTFFLAAGDLNGDGRPDLALSRYSAVSPSVQVLLNTTAPGATTPSLAAPQDLPAPNNIGVALADFDKDGRLDLVLASRTTIVGVLRNTTALGSATVTVAAEQDFTVGVAPRAVTVADMNLDGWPDVLSVNQNSDNLSVLLNARAVAADGVGLGTIVDDDTALQVNAFTPTPTGFVAHFTRDLDVNPLNLYDQGAAFGAADVTLTDSNSNEVRGSVVIGPGLRTITFIKTGGPLAPDAYTVRLFSGASAFKDTGVLLLDGNNDAVGGDDYLGNFTVAAPPAGAITLSVPDFARGYGQAVNLPASGTTGLPISISNAQGVKSASFSLLYDTSLLTITGATVGTGIAGTVTTFDTSTPGVARIVIESATELGASAGAQTLVNLTASAPSAAPYASKQILNLASIELIDTALASLLSIDDDGIHIAAYFGDTNGSQTYNAPDATLAQRIIVGPNTGFSAYPLADPNLIADINGGGTIAANDVTLIQRAIVGIATTQIPPHPGLNFVASGGPDPLVYIPQDLTGAVGLTVSVPVQLLVTEPTGVTLAGADLAIAYDPTKFKLTDAEVGSLLVGFGLNANTATPGLIRLSLSGGSLTLPHNAAGTLATLDFTILAGAGTSSSINLLASSASLHTALYDDLGGALTLLPAPTDAADDAVDGFLRILPDRQHSAAQFAHAVDEALSAGL